MAVCHECMRVMLGLRSGRKGFRCVQNIHLPHPGRVANPSYSRGMYIVRVVVLSENPPSGQVLYTMNLKEVSVLEGGIFCGRGLHLASVEVSVPSTTVLCSLGKVFRTYTEVRNHSLSWEQSSLKVQRRNYV